MKVGLAELAARTLLLPLIVAMLRVLLGFELRGTRFVPETGPAIVVANHGGYLDPLFLQSGTWRPIRYMMTSDFYDVPGAQWFFRMFRAIRVNENGPPRDSIRGALDVLKDGGVVGLYPEGQLSPDGELSPIMPGISFLAARSKAPIVPAWIRGSFHVCRRGRVFPHRHKVSVVYGRPFRIENIRDETGPERILAAWRELKGDA